MGAFRLHDVADSTRVDVPEGHSWRETLLPPPPTPTARSVVMRAARPVTETPTDQHGRPVHMEMDWNDCLNDRPAARSSEHERQTVPRDPHPSRPTLPSPRWDEGAARSR